MNTPALKMVARLRKRLHSRRAEIGGAAPAPVERELLLTEREAADLLGFSAGKLKGLRQAGQIKFVQSGLFDSLSARIIGSMGEGT